jgi:hypothetical protein
MAQEVETLPVSIWCFWRNKLECFNLFLESDWQEHSTVVFDYFLESE